MLYNSLRLAASPIQFGTDGWRGVLGVDFTIERLLKVASAAAQELAYRAPSDLKSHTIVIGYDRRFLAPELAEAIASAVRGCELQPADCNSRPNSCMLLGSNSTKGFRCTGNYCKSQSTPLVGAEN